MPRAIARGVFFVRSDLFDQAYGVRRHAQPLARKAEMLLGGRLDVDPSLFNAQCVCEILPHRFDIRGDLGTLSDEGSVDVDEEEKNS